jgi:hypothetical protein
MSLIMCDYLQVMIAKAFGRHDDSKLRGVTILHTGNATEQVRLPPRGDGVTLHPGVRSKLPLGKRVRAKVRKSDATGAAATSPTSPTNGDVRKKKHRRRPKEVIVYNEKSGAHHTHSPSIPSPR